MQWLACSLQCGEHGAGRGPTGAPMAGPRKRRVSMSETLRYPGFGTTARTSTHTLFAQTMGYVAVTVGFFALGAYLGRNLSYGWAFVAYIIAFACLIGMNFAVRASGSLATVLLFAVGLLLGLATAPILVYYATMN